MITPRRREADEIEPWLISYADVATLLLAFFITLLSISQLNKTKLELLSRYLSMNPEEQTKTLSLPQIEQRVHDLSTTMGLSDSMDVRLTNRGVEIQVKEKLLFDRGKVDVREEALKVLTALGDMFTHPTMAERRIVVEGHTDHLPIRTPQYASNWELSSARACQVVRYFIDRGIDPTRLEANGYADTKPIAPEEPLIGQPLNRRVVLVIS